MADSDFELISNFFTDSGLKYFYRDLESENGLQSIESMKNALDVLNINNHDEITEVLTDIYERFIEYFKVVDTIKYPNKNTYDKCVKRQKTLRRKSKKQITSGTTSTKKLMIECKLSLSSDPRIEIYRYQFKGENLKIFDMLYRIVSVNIGELIKKSGEFYNAYGNYIRSINSDDESLINDKLKVLIEKGKSICGPLINELKASYKRLYRDTNLSDEEDNLLSIPSVSSSSDSLPSTISLDLSDNEPLPETDVSDLEERLADLMNERTDSANVSLEPLALSFSEDLNEGPGDTPSVYVSPEPFSFGSSLSSTLNEGTDIANVSPEPLALSFSEDLNEGPGDTPSVYVSPEPFSFGSSLSSTLNEGTDIANVSPEPVYVDDLQARLDELMNNPQEPSDDNEVGPRELDDDLEARLDALRSGGSKRVRRKKTLRKKNVRKTAKRSTKKRGSKKRSKKRTYKK